ncbi:hypothetical protein L3X38_007782 [Prunus dulcis]|uniref:Uncharacterized protein n=1 Tax=Prunus dulcis TaxID=3755 RepID=A0AAD5F6B0_PRUDU|nr:hypothetical protein L3X38_007782 [Prunus dulcis]
MSCSCLYYLRASAVFVPMLCSVVYSNVTVIMGDNSIVGAVAVTFVNLCVSDSIPGTGSNTWIIDTVASNHMTYNAKFFDELSSNTRDPYITSVNGLPYLITGERGSELESLRLENLELELENNVFEDIALEKKTTGRTEASNRLPISEDETCGLCEETTGHPLELYWLPISGDEAGALGVETTCHIEPSD